MEIHWDTGRSGAATAGVTFCVLGALHSLTGTVIDSVQLTLMPAKDNYVLSSILSHITLLFDLSVLVTAALALK